MLEKKEKEEFFAFSWRNEPTLSQPAKGKNGKSEEFNIEGPDSSIVVG